MSNPTMNAECTAADAFKHAGENIVFASGSPFENVQLGNGKVGYVNQANNMYLFTGIGLGSLVSGARFITDGMLQAAAECLASYMSDEEIQKGNLYPSINSIRHITAEVGARDWRKGTEKWDLMNWLICFALLNILIMQNIFLGSNFYKASRTNIFQN